MARVRPSRRASTPHPSGPEGACAFVAALSPAEQERLRVLRSYGVLDTPPEAAFERITRLAARIFEAPISLISLVDEHRQWFKSACGLAIRETPRPLSFCAHAIRGGEVMVVPDATRDPRFADNALVTGDPLIRFYAGAPLRTPEGQNLGTLSVIDRRPREFGEPDRRSLVELAAQVVDELILRRAAAELRREIEQREHAEAALSKALRSVESQVQARTADLSRTNERLRESEQRLRRLAELGEFALRGGGVEELLREAVRSARTALDIDYCAVVEHLPAEGRLVPRAALGPRGEQLHTTDFLDGKGSAVGYALLTAGPVVVEDTATETRFRQSVWVRDSGARSGATVLIGGDGTHLPPFGTLSVYSRELRSFSPDDVFFLQGIANILAAAINRRRAEEAVQVAREAAELANSAKSSFLSRMSHELRTPLNAILGFSQLLQMDAGTDRQKECCKHVLAGGQQLLSMIDDVLDISRLELGPAALALEAVSPHDIIPLSIDLIRPLSAPRRVTVEFLPETDKPVLVNRQRLNQILLNLLTNAVKYNRAGGRVTVRCRAMPSARLRILVSDTGPGISPENLARLFVPFDRLGAERTEVPGTGLGLALCKNLVEAQGGQIGVESVVGEGSTFWIQLPQALSPPAVRPGAPSPARPPPPIRRVPRKRRQTVLYIEDNTSNLLLIQRLLERHPHVRLVPATTGGQGLALARRRRPDLILLDLHLPDLSGRELLAALQTDPLTRPIPVVVVSADALPANIEALRQAGARYYLTKPLDCRELMDILAELA